MLGQQWTPWWYLGILYSMDNRGPNLLRAQRRPPCRWQRSVSTARRLSAILFRIVLPMLKSPIFLSFFFSLSSFSGIPYHRADDTLPKLFQNFFFFKRAREPRNKPRDLNLPISQNTWRSSNISPFSIIEQCANLSELPVQILPCLLRQTPTYIDDKNKNYIHIYIIPSTNQ